MSLQLAVSDAWCTSSADSHAAASMSAAAMSALLLESVEAVLVRCVVRAHGPA